MMPNRPISHGELSRLCRAASDYLFQHSHLCEGALPGECTFWIASPGVFHMQTPECQGYDTRKYYWEPKVSDGAMMSDNRSVT